MGAPAGGPLEPLRSGTAPVSRGTTDFRGDACGVSRETDGPAAELLRHLFGARAGQAEDFAAMLGTAGVERGLIGPREVPRIWDRHVLNCAVVAPALPSGATVVDVGSGAGLPGLVLALARPDVRLVLVEPLLRRTVFLEEAVTRLDLGQQVEVRRGRAQIFAGMGADVATARAVAALDRLAGWCLPLVRPGGVLLAWKGDRAEAELAEAGDALRTAGAASWSVETYGQELVDPPARVVRVVRLDAAIRR